MAGSAGYAGVRAVQRKTRVSIVNELQFLPAGRAVASLAIRRLFSLLRSQELGLMRILVTGGTLYGDRLHPHDVLAGPDSLDHVA